MIGQQARPKIPDQSEQATAPAGVCATWQGPTAAAKATMQAGSGRAAAPLCNHQPGKAWPLRDQASQARRDNKAALAAWATEARLQAGGRPKWQGPAHQQPAWQAPARLQAAPVVGAPRAGCVRGLRLWRVDSQPI